MKTKIFRTSIILFVAFFLLISCSKEEAQKKDDRVLLVPFDQIKFGWGKGRANHPGYLSLTNGIAKPLMAVSPADSKTMELVDVVFPGDFGHSGGGLFITAPSYSGAAYEYCKDWLRKKGTRFAVLPDYDSNKYERVKTVSQLLALEKKHAIYYYDFIALPAEGTTFIIRTEGGEISIVFIHKINGTYGSLQANLVLSLKTIQKRDP